MLWYKSGRDELPEIGAKSKGNAKSRSRPETLEPLRLSDQFGERSSLHLAHYLSAVNFNRDFASPEF